MGVKVWPGGLQGSEFSAEIVSMWEHLGGGAAEKSGEEEGQGRGRGGRDRRGGRPQTQEGETRCGGLGFLLPCPTGADACVSVCVHVPL